MKCRALTCIATMTLFAVLAIPVRLAAQEQTEEEHSAKHHRYQLVDTGTFGGPASLIANDPTGAGAASGVLNIRGTVVGGADTSLPNPNYPNCCLLGPVDPFILHAFQWRNGVLTDLGVLPGGNDSFANWISANGLIAGLSENGEIDPLLGVPQTRAVLWKDGEIINLGTLEGGYESTAFAVNNKGQVVGGALNTIPDPFSVFGLQVRAFLWQNGVMEDLGTLGGPEATAFFVNESGQVVGYSFTNSTANPGTGIPTQDPFLWEKGTMMDLGTLGGTFGVPNALNNRGQVVGQSNLAGDLTFHPFLWDRGVLTDLGTLGGSLGSANWINDAGEVVGWAHLQGDQSNHAFLWKNGVMTDLGTVEGDPCIGALGINSSGQVVGNSGDCHANLHAFLWEKGSMIDLNTVIPQGSSLRLTLAYDINDRGEIAGLGVPPGVRLQDVFSLGHTFLLIPCDGDQNDSENHNSESCEGRSESTNGAPQSDSAATNQGSTATTQAKLTPSETLAAVRARFGRPRGFGVWTGK